MGVRPFEFQDGEKGAGAFEKAVKAVQFDCLLPSRVPG